MRKTDGVPLFVEELTKMVLESVLLQERGDHYDLKGPLPPLAIPATLHDALMARLDRLAAAKLVAQLGRPLGAPSPMIWSRLSCRWMKQRFTRRLRSWAFASQGHAQEGLAQLQQGVIASRATGAETFRPYFLALLADVHGVRGQPTAGTRRACRSAGACRPHGRTLVRAGAVSPEGCTPGTTVFGPSHGGGNLFCPCHGYGLKPIGKILGTPCCHEPKPAVAATGPTYRRIPVAGPGLRLVHRGL